jgi:hypothetical protein
MMATAPESMPLWFFDEQKGLWVEEGVATKQGSSYVGSVKHFTDWNADKPSENNGDLTGLVHCNGIPMPGVLVRIGQTAAYTDQDGRFFRYVPIGIDLDVIVEPAKNQGLFESALMVVPMLTSREARDITIPLTSNCPSAITGVLTDDQERPIAGHVEWINDEGQVASASTLDGTFYLRVPGNSNITLEASSWSCVASKTFSVTSGNGDTKDVGKLKLCSTDETVVGDIDISTFGMPSYATLSPSGAQVAINGYAPVVVFRSATDGKLGATASLGGGTYHYTLPPTFSSDGSRLSVYDYYMRGVQVFDASTGNRLCSVGVNSGMITPDGNSVLVITNDSSQTPPHVALFSVATGQETRSFSLDISQLGYYLQIVGITSDGTRALIVGRSNIIVYDLVNDAVISNNTPTGYELANSGTANMSADGAVLSTVAREGNYFFSAMINTQTGAIINRLSPLGNFTPVAVSPDGISAAMQDSTANGDGLTPKLVKVADGSEIRLLTTDGEPGRYIHFTFSADGKRLVGVYVREEKMMIRFWDL